MINKSRNLYLNGSIIYEDSEDEQKFVLKTDFGDFMKVNDRDILIA